MELRLHLEGEATLALPAAPKGAGQSLFTKAGDPGLHGPAAFGRFGVVLLAFIRGARLSFPVEG